jgi:dihydroorotate dehydrogenase electron transfer subunit
MALFSETSASAPRGLFDATVIENRPLCREHYLLRLRVPGFPATRPGQFVQVLCRAGASDGEDREVEWREGEFPHLSRTDTVGRAAVLRRPFSLAGRRDLGDGSAEIELIQRVVGPGTGYLETLEPGQSVDILGPLGNVFPLPGEDQIVLLVGGGVGIPPMIYVAQELCRPKVIAFCGAQTRDLLSLTVTNDAPPPKSASSVEPLYNIAEFSRYGVPVVVSTDDGSYGFKGYVTQALQAYLDRFFDNTWEVGSKRPVVMTCGPEVMMKAVADVCLKRGLMCHAAVERAMACGMGTCQSCVIRVKSPDSPQGWRYALACTEGPIFNTTELLW